jgi:hypothetical protein
MSFTSSSVNFPAKVTEQALRSDSENGFLYYLTGFTGFLNPEFNLTSDL